MSECLVSAEAHLRGLHTKAAGPLNPPASFCTLIVQNEAGRLVPPPPRAAGFGVYRALVIGLRGILWVRNPKNVCVCANRGKIDRLAVAEEQHITSVSFLRR